MKIGLISDTHGDADAWRKAMGMFASCDLILHAGDHLYHGIFNPILPTYEPLELAREMNECGIPILHVRGNCDSEVDQLALRDPLMSPYVICDMEGTRIMVTHGDVMQEMELVELAKRYRVRLLVRGHTHVHGIWDHGSLVVCNPGSPTMPKQDEVPSVAVVDEGRVSLCDLRDGSVLYELDLPKS